MEPKARVGEPVSVGPKERMRRAGGGDFFLYRNMFKHLNNHLICLVSKILITKKTVCQL